MAVSRMILPNYIVGNFVPAKACRRCGRSDGSFTLLFPQLNWHGDEIELIYPLRCSCGGSGCVRIRLPTLLFGYILASVSLVDAANHHRSKARMTVKASSTDILVNIFRNFDHLMEACATAAPRSPALPIGERNCIDGNDADDAERIKFGFDKDEWKQFLRRLGLDRPGEKDGES